MIAVDCFLKIKIPLKYRVKVTKRRLKVAIITSWLLSFAIGLVVVFGVGFIPWKEQPNNRANVIAQAFVYTNYTEHVILLCHMKVVIFIWTLKMEPSYQLFLNLT